MGCYINGDSSASWQLIPVPRGERTCVRVSSVWHKNFGYLLEYFTRAIALLLEIPNKLELVSRRSGYKATGGLSTPESYIIL